MKSGVAVFQANREAKGANVVTPSDSKGVTTLAPLRDSKGWQRCHPSWQEILDGWNF